MKAQLIALFLIPTLWVSAHAQRLTSAGQVIDKYLNAIGGKKALMQIKDVSVQSIMSNSSGSYPLINKFKMPASRLVVINDTTGKVIYKEVIDGKQVSTKFDDKMIPTNPADLQRTLLSAQFTPELTLAEKGIKYTLAGTESINGKDGYKISYTLSDGVSLWTSYYDVQTGLKLRSVHTGQTGPEMMDYSDYREVNGVKVPYHFSGYGAETQASKYEMNTGLSNAEFLIK